MIPEMPPDDGRTPAPPPPHWHGQPWPLLAASVDGGGPWDQPNPWKYFWGTVGAVPGYEGGRRIAVDTEAARPWGTLLLGPPWLRGGPSTRFWAGGAVAGWPGRIGPPYEPQSQPPPVDLGTGILEALPYANIAQAPNPPPAESNDGDLATMAQEILDALSQDPFLTDFIPSRQWSTLGALPEAVQHPEDTLLQEYIDKGIPVHTGPA